MIVMSLKQSFQLLPLGVLVVVLARTSAFAGTVCQKREEATPALHRLADVMVTGRFVAYDPISLQVVNGRVTQANEASIFEDLKVLRPRFDGLITYTSANGAEKVPEIAAKLGYRAVIVGVHDVESRQDPGGHRWIARFVT
jgi:hypothetical protein